MTAAGSTILDPGTVGWVETYRRLTEVVVPRPIALVSSVDRHGRANVAPFSFFTVVSCNPPLLAVAPQLGGRTGAKKDTLRNAEEVGQLVIAVVTEAMAERLHAVGRLGGDLWIRTGDTFALERP